MNATRMIRATEAGSETCPAFRPHARARPGDEPPGRAPPAAEKGLGERIGEARNRGDPAIGQGAPERHQEGRVARLARAHRARA